MDWYPWLVFLHVVGSFAFVLAHGTSAVAAFRLRSEREPARIAALLDLSSASIGLVYLSLLVVLVSGVALGFFGGYWGRLWIWLSLGLLIAVLAAMFAIAAPYYGRLRRAVGQKAQGDPKDAPPPDPLPAAEIAALLTSSRPFVLAAVGGIGLAAIIWLMMFQPF
jgi:HAMP domain-containing protein